MFVTNESTKHIVECYRLNDIYKFVREDSLVVFDIDCVLLIPLTNNDARLTPEVAKQNLNYMWYDNWDKHISITAGDPEASKIINGLQANGIQTMAHTSRPPRLKEVTMNQLNVVGIDFKKRPITKDLSLKPTIKKHGFAFINGMLMTDNSVKAKSLPSKGKTLSDFLDNISCIPGSVIFIDDDHRNLQDVIKVLQAKQITTTGLWYKAHEKNYPITTKFAHGQ